MQPPISTPYMTLQSDTIDDPNLLKHRKLSISELTQARAAKNPTSSKTSIKDFFGLQTVTD